MLSQSDWNGAGYKLLVCTPAEMRAKLDRLDVKMIVIDSRSPPAQVPHHEILRSMVAAAPDSWPLVARFSEAGGAREIDLYRRGRPNTSSRTPIEIPMPENLQRTLRQAPGVIAKSRD